MLGICENGHQTGQKKCALCGAKRTRFAPGEGRCFISKQQLRAKIRAANGRDPLGELRRATSVGGGGGSSAAKKQGGGYAPLPTLGLLGR